MPKYPMFIKSSSKFIQELTRCETGRNEDAQAFREIAKGKSDPTYTQKEAEEACNENDYWVTLCDFSDRHKNKFEVRDDAELCELYYACASGTIGLFMCKAANRILDIIREDVRKIDPELVRVWPRQDGY